MSAAIRTGDRRASVMNPAPVPDALGHVDDEAGLQPVVAGKLEFIAGQIEGMSRQLAGVARAGRHTVVVLVAAADPVVGVKVDIPVRQYRFAVSRDRRPL